VLNIKGHVQCTTGSSCLNGRYTNRTSVQNSTIPCGSLCYNCAEEGRICFRPPSTPLQHNPFIASRFSTPHVILNNLKNRSHHRRYLWGKVKIEYGTRILFLKLKSSAMFTLCRLVYSCLRFALDTG